MLQVLPWDKGMGCVKVPAYQSKFEQLEMFPYQKQKVPYENKLGCLLSYNCGRSCYAIIFEPCLVLWNPPNEVRYVSILE